MYVNLYEGKFELEDVDIGYNLDNMRGPADYLQTSGNSDLLENLERVIEVWSRQIDQVGLDQLFIYRTTLY